MDISSFSPIGNLFSYSTIDGLIHGKVTTLINFGTGFAALIAVIMIIVAGYKFITSAGDADKIDSAQKTLTASIIGLVIIFIARLLVEFVVKLVTQ